MLYMFPSSFGSIIPICLLNLDVLCKKQWGFGKQRIGLHEDRNLGLLNCLKMNTGREPSIPINSRDVTFPFLVIGEKSPFI